MRVGARGNSAEVANCVPHMRRACLAAVLSIGAMAASARLLLAHPDRPIQPHDLATAWTLDPVVLASIAIPAWLLLRGTRRLWSHAGTGRGVKRWQVACAAAGFLILLAALVSPLHQLGGALFAAHMAQHQLLMVVAAPLLILGAPMTSALWAFDQPLRRRIGAFGNKVTQSRAWRTLLHPVSAWTLHAAAIWAWHAPPLYERTLTNEWVHTAQHFSFFGTALLFWWSVIHPRGGAVRGYGLAALAVFTTAVHGSLLGALLTFSKQPWYPSYAGRVEPWGTTMLQDQQLGGLIMWVPAGFVYTVAAMLLLERWMRAMDGAVPSASSATLRDPLLLQPPSAAPRSRAES